MKWSKNKGWYIETDGYRISKAISQGAAIYTAWKKTAKGYQAIKYGSLPECKKACSEDSNGR
ncbi:hypothetical protein GCM10023116_43430 [Kistimonas scapharcae]|uniref:DUF1508 domain-containing protein n=1 Tax=Kistimonas scapharcae TaxID=1036133 RepID=A0ABP8V7V9_9GAMM